MQITEEVKRKLGQHFVLGFHGQEVSEDIKVLIREYHVGNVILMKRNVKDAVHIRKVIQELQTIAKESGQEFPLMIGTDQEQGLVSAFSSSTSATQFPGAMSLAATGSVELTEETYAATGKQLKMLGVNWAYSPVADVNSNPKNPVIGVRSFGDDPEEVGRFAHSAARGLTRSGVAPSPKHFPGHGDTHVDSHLALPRIMKSSDDLASVELVPFKRLFQDPDNVATIMTGHMALPLITGGDEPCSLSRKITTDLLRKELGFQGVVVTDCLEMDAIAEPAQGGCGVEEGSVRALEAGADVLMICHTMERQVGAIRKVWDAVESGRLSWEELEASQNRIKSLKLRFGTTISDEEFNVSWEKTKGNAVKLSESAYEKSIAVIRDPLSILPLKSSKSGPILVYTPEIEGLNKAIDDAEGVLRGKGGEIRNTAGASFSALAASISRRVPAQQIVYLKSGQEERSPISASEVSAIVFTLRNADRAPWQIAKLKKISEQFKAKIPIVILASCTPYDLEGVEGVDDLAFVASFEYTPLGFEAATKVLFGEVKATGRVPVKLSS
ncbi:glycoside hydrolase family 3 protein [Atractiella rhizophila]|nr:glycoside hydrolase family 3 protein [Atractiella rhizophila]